MCEAVKNGTLKTTCVPVSKVSIAPAGSFLGTCPPLITKLDIDQKSGSTSKASSVNLPTPVTRVVGSEIRGPKK
jgi:hypothetical protein